MPRQKERKKERSGGRRFFNNANNAKDAHAHIYCLPEPLSRGEVFKGILLILYTNEAFFAQCGSAHSCLHLSIKIGPYL